MRIGTSRCLVLERDRTQGMGLGCDPGGDNGAGCHGANTDRRPCGHHKRLAEARYRVEPHLIDTRGPRWQCQPE